MFVGREKELSELERVYNQDGFRLFVVGGCSGSGKTALLKEFCRDKNTIYFTAYRESGRANLVRFSLDIFAHYNDFLHKPFQFWNSAFRYIRSKNDSRIIIVIDELSFLTDRDSMFMSMLRKCIDSELAGSNVFMIIASSDIKLLHKSFLGRLEYTDGSLMLDRFTLNDETVEQLKKQALRQGLSSDSSRMMKFSADEVIIREGEVNSEMYKIISGKAVCYFGYDTDDEYVIGTLKEGRSFGEYSLLTRKPGIYTVTAFTDMLVLKISENEFSNFLTMNAGNSIEIMKNMAGMIHLFKANIDMLRVEQSHSLQ